MSGAEPDAGTVGIKVVLAGSPHAGKAAIVHRLCEVQGGRPLRSQEIGGAHLVVGDLTWPEPLSDGRTLHVTIHTLYGAPDHRGVIRLLLQACDGLVFLADTNPQRISEAPGQLGDFLADAGRAGVDWGKTVAALQYHRVETCPDFRADVMSHFLQIPPGQLECFATTADPGDDGADAIAWVVRRIAQKMSPPREATG